MLSTNWILDEDFGPRVLHATHIASNHFHTMVRVMDIGRVGVNLPVRIKHRSVNPLPNIHTMGDMPIEQSSEMMEISFMQFRHRQVRTVVLLIGPGSTFVHELFVLYIIVGQAILG